MNVISAFEVAETVVQGGGVDLGWVSPYWVMRLVVSRS